MQISAKGAHMSGEKLTGARPEEFKTQEEAQARATEMDSLDIEIVIRRLIQLGVLAEGTKVKDEKKPYLGQTNQS